MDCKPGTTSYTGSLEIRDRVRHRSNFQAIVLEVTGDSAATQHLLDAATYYSPTYDVCQKSVDMAVDKYCGGYSVLADRSIK